MRDAQMEWSVGVTEYWVSNHHSTTPVLQSRRGDPAQRSRSPFSSGWLAPVENLVTEISHRQSHIVRPSAGLHGDAGVFNLTDENRMIPLFNRVHQSAFDESRSLFQARGAQTPLAKWLAADRIALPFERFAESKSL